jgi:hypothetical protein
MLSLSLLHNLLFSLRLLPAQVVFLVLSFEFMRYLPEYGDV